MKNKQPLRFSFIVFLLIVVGLFFACKKKDLPKTSIDVPNPNNLSVELPEVDKPTPQQWQEVKDALQLKPGMVVADIGCGTGRFTFPIAREVGPQGKVYAVDINKSRLDFMKTQMTDKELYPYDNVVIVNNRFDSTSLPDNSADAGLVISVHFHNRANLTPDNKLMLKSIYATLRPGALLFVDDGMDWDEKNVKIPVKQVAVNLSRNYRKAGFLKIRPAKIDGDSCSLVFRKPKK